MKNMKGRQKLSDNQSSASIQAAVPEMPQSIGSINMTDNHSLFFSPGDGSKDFGAVLHEVQEYISGKYSTLIIDGETEDGKAQVKRYIGKYLMDHRIAVKGMLWQILMKETAPLNLQDGEPCYTSAIFHDKEYKESNVDVEVQKSVRGSYPNTQNVLFKTEPPVLVASATYKGSYEEMDKVNEAVANWVQDNCYDFNGPAFNIYHVSPHETQNPEEWVTEVCYPVKKK
ncbi:GyrI-like domain-containing protein [Caproiciproducens sp.]|uniref:GyrI-like domain-containing protein n=1 Tax=Caproiciproducens sp. TaxID=1954376 RepID=UPI0028977F60|nr:GyrI-like domain-containing protein [Caproiciproducens sp.]